MTKLAQSPPPREIPTGRSQPTQPGDLVAQESSHTWRPWAGVRAIDLAPFLAVAVEFFLIVLLVVQFQLESQTFARLMYLAFAGFLVHHFLPERARLPFFAALSVGVTAAAFQGTATLWPSAPGVTLIAIGLAMVGVCH